MATLLPFQPCDCQLNVMTEHLFALLLKAAPSAHRPPRVLWVLDALSILWG